MAANDAAGKAARNHRGPVSSPSNPALVGIRLVSRQQANYTCSRMKSAGKIPAIVFLACVVVFAERPAKKLDSANSSHTPAPRITVLGVSNFAEVTPDLYRGGQPKGKGYTNLKKKGVDIIVDLRLSGKGTERRNVEQAGMSYVSIPWHCLFPKDKDFAEFLLLLRENKNKKVFVHCRYGDDRTGMMIAAYRMAVEGWTPEEARKEMNKFGFHHVICHPLESYEEHFPEHLQKNDDFKQWREEVGASAH